jgi:hypothetical protein
VTRPALFYALAAVVPLAALWLAAPPERSAHGMAVPPFGWPSLLVAHCLAAVPLAAVAAGQLVKRVKVSSVVPPVVVGLLVAVVGYFAVQGVAGSLDPSADFALRCLVRTLVCLLLALPWAVAARAEEAPARGSWVTVAVGLAVAFLLPGIWAGRLAKENADAAQGEVSVNRTTRGRRLLDGVCDLDPRRVMADGKTDAAEARRQLVAEEKALTVRVAGADPSALRPTDRLLHANGLVSLDRPAEAEPILRDLARTQPQVNLPLARALHLLGRYEGSDAAARTFLAEAIPEVNKPVDESNKRQVELRANIRRWCVEGFDLLAENATKRGDNIGREAALREGLEKLPAEEAYFRFQLGRHYKVSGRPVDAVRELNEAGRLDDNYRVPAEALIRELRELTPACLIGR